MPSKLIPPISIIAIISVLLLLFLFTAWAVVAEGPDITPGPYLALALKAQLTSTPTPTSTATPDYGILLISEVMVHPGYLEPDGEWVELYNAGGASIDLSTYKLGDEETRNQGEGMLQFPAGARLAPGQVLVIANNGANFHTSYGFFPDYEMVASSPAVPDLRKYRAWANGSINLVNGGDEILVLNGANNVVDSISWGDSSWAFYPACAVPYTDWSLERYPASRDTDQASDWREQSLPAPGKVDLTFPTSTPTQTPTQTYTRSPSPTVAASPTYSHTPLSTHPSSITPTHTPGSNPTLTQTVTDTKTNTPASTSTQTETVEPSITPTGTQTPTRTLRPTPAGGWLLISEVFYDPTGAEPDGEWIELYNAGSEAIDLANYKVGDEETRGDHEGMYQFPISATITAGQVILVANHANVFYNAYGFYPDYEFVESVENVPNMTAYIGWSTGLVDLHNLGDEVLVLDGSDQFVDTVSWGSSDWAFFPDCPVVIEGHSIERYPANIDTDTVADWIDQEFPNPGSVFIPKRY